MNTYEQFSNSENIPKEIYWGLKSFIILSTIIIGIFTLYISYQLYNYQQFKQNRKKLLFLCSSILCLTMCYAMQEIIQFFFFEKMETIFRDFLYLICFYFFFLDLIPMQDNNFGFYSFIAILIFGQALNGYDLIY